MAEVNPMNAYDAHFSHFSFEGISKQGMEFLKTEIKDYCTAIENKINSFDANGSISDSVKGTNLEPMVKEYVASIKQLLSAYVSTMRNNVKYATEAYEKYEAAEKSIAKDVQSNAQQVRNTAAGIKLD